MLNVELQRKVGDRSCELAAALRRIRSTGGNHLQPGAIRAERYRVAQPLGALPRALLNIERCSGRHDRYATSRI